LSCPVHRIVGNAQQSRDDPVQVSRISAARHPQSSRRSRRRIRAPAATVRVWHPAYF
jgi:hypothetical protein